MSPQLRGLEAFLQEAEKAKRERLRKRDEAKREDLAPAHPEVLPGDFLQLDVVEDSGVRRRSSTVAVVVAAVAEAGVEGFLFQSVFSRGFCEHSNSTLKT